MERCVVAPAKEGADLLKITPDLSEAALKRGGQQRGDVIVFLPSMQELLSVQILLKKALPTSRVSLLHRDAVGNEVDVEIALPDADNQPDVALSTIIGARTITFESMRYTILHPADRVEVLHASGSLRLDDEPLSIELEGNMCGRVARQSAGLATLMYEKDGTALALSAMRSELRPPAIKDLDEHWEILQWQRSQQAQEHCV